MHLRQFRATIRAIIRTQSTYSVSLQTFSLFRDTGEMYTSIRDGREMASAQYNGTNYIIHIILKIILYCRKLFISYRLSEFSARSVVTVKNDVSDSNNACETTSVHPYTHAH